MDESSYAEIVDQLSTANVPLRELSGQGIVAVTPAAGRVVAMAFSADGPNLFWSNPQLSDTARVRNSPETLVGGYGGDRLWFAPELDYHWDGPPDWKSFSNYKPPRDTEPGAYAFVGQDAHAVTLRAKGALPVLGADRTVGFKVSRTIRLVQPPLPRTDPLMRGIEYVGIESAHTLKVAEDTRTGVIDLWHLLQVPVGSILVVPVSKTTDARQAQPLSYALPGGWVEKPDYILWRYGGEAKAKCGLPAVVLTGRSAVFRKLQYGRCCMIVREFPVDARARYGDHPYRVPRTDQAFQAWDGYGFGEMEFHSLLADAKDGPREINETDRLWAFGGPPAAIRALAMRLLGVDVNYVLEP